jgi:predicted nucleotidyltransferase
MLAARPRVSEWHLRGDARPVSHEVILLQRRAEYAEALDRALDRIVAQLAAMPEVERVILFGSYAAGRRDLFTDLDLLVVMASDQDFVRRTAELYRRISTDVDVDLLVYTPEEFKRLGERGFIRHALTSGKVLYEKERRGSSRLGEAVA